MAPEIKLVTSHSKTRKRQKVYLNGTESIKILETVTSWETKKELDDEGKVLKILSKTAIEKKDEEKALLLKEVSIVELFVARCSGKPGFVLKKDGKYFYCEVPETFSFTMPIETGEHQCGKVCLHVSALPDEEGGCEKVRDCTKLIEKYDFIDYGYEIFNAKHESFRVLSCKNYEKCPPRN